MLIGGNKKGCNCKRLRAYISGNKIKVAIIRDFEKSICDINKSDKWLNGSVNWW